MPSRVRGTAVPVEPYDHYRPTTDDYPDGVYRVVGAGEGDVTLLRVAADGRRVNGGTLVHVPQETLRSAFVDAENPDAGLRPWQAVDWVVASARAVLDLLRRP